MNGSGDEVRYLPAFLAVCEEGGFRRAGERLHLSRPAVSYQIRALERLVGVALFSRAGRGVTLTARGELLRDFCRNAFQDLAAVKERIATGDFSKGETLRVVSVSAFGRYVLFPVISKERAAPRFELRFPTQEEVLEAVTAGLADVGFIYEERVSSALHATPVGHEELVLVAGRAAARARLRTLDEIAAQPFVTWDEYEYVFGQWFQRTFGRQPRAFKSASHVEEMEEVLELVRLGRGQSVVPLDCARSLVKRGALAVLRPRRGRRVLNMIHAVQKPDRRSAAAERLIARVAGAFGPTRRGGGIRLRARS
jgi:DNA-binding transcriptional LysR family regulator